MLLLLPEKPVANFLKPAVNEKKIQIRAIVISSYPAANSVLLLQVTLIPERVFSELSLSRSLFLLPTH